MSEAADSLTPPMTTPTATADPLAGLNPEQRKAAAAVQGPVCILAGAGTGKTRTVTHRIAHQIASGVARADQILAVTFTDRAAAELRARLAALGVPPVRAATFHAAAWAQLRHYWSESFEGPLPQVLPSKLRLLIPTARRLRVEAADLAAEIEWAKARRLSPAAYVSAAAGRAGPLAPEKMAEVFTGYEKAKSALGAIDYEDMLLCTTELLTSNAHVAAGVRDRYRFFTVDEYQDVNPAQHALLRAWLGERSEVCVVGDDDQTIYSFTGASSAYLTGFPREFPGATVVTLTRNYRSTGPVIDLANRVLWTKPQAARKRLESQVGTGPAPVFRSYGESRHEVGGVVSGCGELTAAGVPPGDIAVLYRVNAQSEAFEEAFRDAGLPYTVRGDAGFFARPEVRQALRLLAADRERPPDVIGGVEVTAAAVGRRVQGVLSAGLDYAPHREPKGAVARERWRNLGALVTAATEAVAGDPDLTYARLVEDFLTRAASGSGGAGPGGSITLSTLHGAKGLEFAAVFLVACEEGLLPISHARTDEAVEEERRLLYVGVTRARRHLQISWALSRTGRSGREQQRRPSRLLYNLGEGAPRAGQPSAPRKTLAGDQPAAPRRGSGGALSELSGASAVRGERLRAWRAERAKRDQVPAFVVFSDKTLAALATIDAGTLSSPDSLLSVPGVGPTKLARYGEELLPVLLAERAPV